MAMETFSPFHPATADTLEVPTGHQQRQHALGRFNLTKPHNKASRHLAHPRARAVAATAEPLRSHDLVQGLKVRVLEPCSWLGAPGDY